MRFEQGTLAEAERGLCGLGEAEIALTHTCNLACDYCDVSHNLVDPLKRPMAEEQLAAIVAFLAAHAGPDGIEVTLSGGEPMSYWPALTQAVESLQTALGPRLTALRVATNATLVRPDRAAWLTEHGVQVTVGLDGLESAHDAHRTNTARIGSWRRTTAGIAGLIEAGIVPDISMVVTADTMDRAAAGIDWICENYRPGTMLAVAAAPATPGGTANRPAPEAWADLLVAAHRHWEGTVRIQPVAQVCDAVRSGEPILHSEAGAWGGAITTDARGLAAPSLPLLAAGIGCVRLAEIDLEAGPFQQWRGRSPARRPECAGCPALGYCGNATMYASAAVGGAPDALDPWHCRMQRKLVGLLKE